MSPKTSRKTGTGGGAYQDRRGVTPRRIAGLVLAALVLVFIFENTQHTKIRLLIPLVTMPQWLALLGTAVVGAVCGAIFMSRRG
ncbi:LapA family protein [Streptomyces sp. NPDC048664]|uniref:LapA family protein n=1 Tax=Streptomyces sp. NPDC048664 TaxID=3154505 RepID=UPI00344AD141